MATARGLSILTLIVAVGLASPAMAQQPAPAPTAAQVEQERAQTPHPALMEAIDAAVGAKAPALLRLSAAKSQDVKAAHDVFDHQVRDFIRTHAAGTGDPSAAIPSRSDTEAKILAMLRPDQRAAVEAKLKDAATKRLTDRQSSHTSNHTSNEYRSPDGHSASKSESSSETSNSSESSRSSQSDHHSDHHSSSSKDSKSAHDSKTSKDSKSSGQQGASTDSKQSSQGASQTKSWSAQNSDERRATIRTLLDQLPDADRAALQKELKIEPAPR
jgi:hypothetical protein